MVAGQSGKGESFVSIKVPSDNIFTSAKQFRNADGSPVPSSTEAVLGSSPDLPHKEPVRVPQSVLHLSGSSPSFTDLGSSKGLVSEVGEATPMSDLATSNSLMSSLEGGDIFSQ